MIEKENYIRRRLRKVCRPFKLHTSKIFNLKEDDFESLHKFNDYLEMVETYVVNLTTDTNVDITEKEVLGFPLPFLVLDRSIQGKVL